MESFEDLGLGPELVEALASEGIERPTSIQVHALPVLRRGNSAVVRAGPGAGATAAWGCALFERLEAGGGAPRAIVLSGTRDEASRTARSLAPLGLATGHRCAALGGAWALPAHADLLAATPADLEEAVGASEVKVEEVRAVVLLGGALLEEPDAPRVGRLVELLAGRETQWIVVADPITRPVRELVDAHLRRAVFLPPEAAGEASESAPVERGSLEVVPRRGDRPDQALLPVVAQALGTGARHVLLHVRSDDLAADAADFLLLHGYAPGLPGDEEVPVWLAVDPLEARERLREAGGAADGLVTISADVPPDADTLDRRHGGGAGEAIVLALPRELPHLRRIAAEAGYTIREGAGRRPAAADSIAAFRDRVEEALASEDLGAYMSVVEPLFERWTPAEVAAALAALLRRRPASEGPAAPAAEGIRTPGTAAGRPPAYTRLFLSVGSRDGVGPGDLLGAITGEAGLRGDQVGRIDIRDTFSRVEVQDRHANEVIRALNGVTIRGRSVRADFDRGDQREAAPKGGRGGGRRREPGKRGGPRPDRGGREGE